MSKATEIKIHVMTIVLIFITITGVIPSLVHDVDDSVEGYGVLEKIKIQSKPYESGRLFFKRIRYERSVLLVLNTGNIIRLNGSFSRIKEFSDKQSLGKQLTYYYVDNETTGYITNPVQIELDNKIIYDNQKFAFLSYSIILLTLLFMVFSISKLVIRIKKFRKEGFARWDLSRH